MRHKVMRLPDPDAFVSALTSRDEGVRSKDGGQEDAAEADWTGKVTAVGKREG